MKVNPNVYDMLNNMPNACDVSVFYVFSFVAQAHVFSPIYRHKPFLLVQGEDGHADVAYSYSRISSIVQQ